MNIVFHWFRLILTAIGGFIGWLCGGWDGFLYTLLAFVVTDYITGLICAGIDKTLSSAVGFRGIAKKVLIFALVGVAHMVDSNLIGSGDMLRTAVIFFYLSNEGISIIENVGHIGLPVPKKLRDVLAQLDNGIASEPQGDEDDGGDE